MVSNRFDGGEVSENLHDADAIQRSKGAGRRIPFAE